MGSQKNIYRRDLAQSRPFSARACHTPGSAAAFRSPPGESHIESCYCAKSPLVSETGIGTKGARGASFHSDDKDRHRKGAYREIRNAPKVPLPCWSRPRSPTGQQSFVPRRGTGCPPKAQREEEAQRPAGRGAERTELEARGQRAAQAWLTSCVCCVVTKRHDGLSTPALLSRRRFSGAASPGCWGCAPHTFRGTENIAARAPSEALIAAFRRSSMPHEGRSPKANVPTRQSVSFHSLFVARNPGQHIAKDPEGGVGNVSGEHVFYSCLFIEKPIEVQTTLRPHSAKRHRIFRFKCLRS